MQVFGPHPKRTGNHNEGTKKISVMEETSIQGAISLVINFVKKNRMDGQIILLSGPIGSGKTALALGVARELGENIPFCAINASEIFSPNSKKTSILHEKCRKAVGIKLFENHEYYEGEIVEIKFSLEKEKEPTSPPFLTVLLRSEEGSLKIKLLDLLYDKFKTKGFQNGDIIRIEPKNDYIFSLGKSLNFFGGQIGSDIRFVTIPKGKVFKKKSIIKEITFNDLDFLNFHNVRKEKQERVEKTEQLYKEVDLLVSQYIQQKKAELLKGVLFIDEAHLLDKETLGFLFKILNSPFPPIIILATNRKTFFRTNLFSKFSFPINFLIRCLIIKTKRYEKKEISKIISLKAKEKGNLLSGKGFSELFKISKENSLRFTIFLTNFSNSLSVLTFQEKISTQHLKISAFLFFHLKEIKKLMDSLNPDFQILKLL